MKNPYIDELQCGCGYSNGAECLAMHNNNDNNDNDNDKNIQ